MAQGVSLGGYLEGRGLSKQLFYRIPSRVIISLVTYLLAKSLDPPSRPLATLCFFLVWVS